MGWAAPHLLLGLAAVAVLLALRLHRGRTLTRLRHGVGAGIAALTGRVARGRAALRLGLLWGGLALGVIALAGPRWSASQQVRRQTGADLLVAIDCSRSMLATDLFPDRMRVARRKALDLLRLAPETRMALVPFAGAAVLRCPLTGDHQALAQMLDDCGPELFPVEFGFQGTAIGVAVQEGLRVLDRQAERGQAILVISDGSDGDTKAVTAAAKRAQEQGVPVYGLFIGDAERATELEVDGTKRDVRAQRDTLDELAKTTGAIAVNATAGDDDVRALHEHLTATVAQTPWEERRRIVQSERFQWPLLAAFALIAVGAALPTRRARPTTAILAEAA